MNDNEFDHHRLQKGREVKSVWRRNGDVDLYTILHRLAPDHGGTGGGHPFEVGVRIPEKKTGSIFI